MSQDPKRILMVLGGKFHDFDGFATAMTPLFQRAGYEVETTYDLDRLLTLAPDANQSGQESGGPDAEGDEQQSDDGDDEASTVPDIVLLYTCFSLEQDWTASGGDLNPKRAAALGRWVRAGGGLLAAHCATVMQPTNRTLRRLLGGSFISHPPQFSFSVLPLSHEHPITSGIGSFAIHDEFYVQDYDADLDIHMVAVDRGVCYPMVWSKQEGPGRVAHVAPGDGPKTWFLPAYRRLMVQALNWLSSDA